MSVAAFPIERTIEAGRQEDRREFLLMAIEGLPPVRARKVLMEACGFDFLSEQDCAAFLDACGLGGA